MISTAEFSSVGFAERLRAGDRDALEAVVRAYLPQVHRAARGAGFSAERADDIAQETFKTFIEKAKTFEGRSHVRTWLFGILYRKINEAWRRVQREREHDDIDRIKSLGDSIVHELRDRDKDKSGD